MISRSNMRRQLQANGGIMNARQGYGAGSWVKEKLRKLIPNELADIAVKAAPFVAPFQPGIAAAMRGIGRFDQRGSVSDALKQAGGTYAFGKTAGKLGGASGSELLNPGRQTYSMEGFKTKGLGKFLGTEGTGTNNAFSKGNDGAKKFAEDQGKGFMEKTTDKIFDKIPFGDKLNQTVKEKLFVGGVTSAATYLYEKFVADYPEPEPGEDMAAYMAERRQRVGTQMRTYMDNYLAYDPQYSAMSDAEKDAFVERNNKNMGGLMRTGYANGSGGITMANTLAQNVAQNRANQTARANELEMARSRLPGYQAPQRAMAPTKAPMLTPADLNPPQLFQPGDPDLNIGIPERPQLGVTPPVERIIPSGGMDFSLPEMTMPMQQDVNWQPGQPAPEGFRVKEMLGDEFLVPDDSQYVPPTEAESMMPTPEGTMGPISLDDFESQNSNPPTARIIQPTLPVEPMTDQNIMEGYAKYKEQNPEIGMGASIQVIINGRLPDGTPLQFNNGAQAAAFNQYLESIGQPPFERTQNPIESKDGGGIASPRKITSGGSGLAKLAVGGRVGQNMGGLMRLNYMIGGEAKQMEAGAPPIMYSGNMDPNAQAGLPSVPGPMQMAEDGPEFDMRENGGFQPLGRQEGKDDVPAMLAKNEFVMTADAVRAAGGGSIQKGAQKMYDTMKKLESRVS